MWHTSLFCLCRLERESSGQLPTILPDFDGDRLLAVARQLKAALKLMSFVLQYRSPLDMFCLERDEAHSIWGMLHVEISADETRLLSAATLEIASLNSGDWMLRRNETD
jgi:hypothetical protein